MNLAASLLFVCICSTAIAQPGPATRMHEAAMIVTRADVARAFLSFERAIAAHPLDDDAKVAAVNREFDRITMRFQMRKFSEAVRALHALTDAIATDEKPRSPEAKLARSLRVRLTPFVGGPKRAVMRIKITPMYSVAGIERPTALRLQISPDVDGASPVVDREIIVEPSGMTSNITMQQPADLPVGRYRVEIAAPDGYRTRAADWFVAETSHDILRQENQHRLGTVRSDTEKMSQALSAVMARNQLLARPTVEVDVIQMLIDPLELASQVEHEISEVQADRDPFVDRTGDYWRTILVGTMHVAARVYAPAKAIESGKPVPLVIALPGAGADENMFMEAYGSGEIKRQAEKHGFIVVSPRTDFVMLAPDAPDRIVRALSHNYLIDASRVYVIGHSLGAVTAQRFGEQFGSSIAAVCQIAGAGALATGVGTRATPTLIIAGELDPIFPISRIRAVADEARRAGRPVEFRSIANRGHTLVVGDTLPLAIEWLLKHPAPPASRVPTRTASGAATSPTSRP